MKFENLKVKNSVIDISEALNLSKINKSDFVRYLEMRSEERFLIFKSYEEEKESLAQNELKELRERVDFMISRIKKGEKELKKKSLEERFAKQKNIVLSNLENRLVGYKKTIEEVNNKITTLDVSEVYIGYPFIDNKVEQDVAIVFPVKIEVEYGNIYIINNIQKEIISNKRVFAKISNEQINFELINEKLKSLDVKGEVVEKIGLLNVEIKSKSTVENLLENKTLSDRMKYIINQDTKKVLNGFSKEISVLKTSNKNIMQIVTQKDDFLLLGSTHKENLIEIIENLLIAGESILVVEKDVAKLQDQVKKIALDTRRYNEMQSLSNDEVINEIKKIDAIIKKILKVDTVMNSRTSIGLTVKEMCAKTFSYELFNSEEHLRYKKSLNLDNTTYIELEEILKEISLDDVDKYKTYKMYKDKFITFNEFPYSYDELMNIKNIIQKIEDVAKEKCNINKKYFKKITFKMKNKGTTLELEELREIGREISREKNRELLIEDKNTWSIKNLFNSSRQKEKRREELELFKEKEIYEIKQILEFYKDLDKNYMLLEAIDKNIFKEIISILCKDNFSEEISRRVKSIEFSLKHKDILNLINSWSNFKIALVDFLYKSKNFTDSIQKLLLFRVSDELLKVSKECGINLAKEYENYEKIDIKKMMEKKKNLFNEYILRKGIDEKNLNIISLEDVEKLELVESDFDTVILVECNIENEEDILPIMYRGKRCISFKDNGCENKYEKAFISLE